MIYKTYGSYSSSLLLIFAFLPSPLSPLPSLRLSHLSHLSPLYLLGLCFFQASDNQSKNRKITINIIIKREKPPETPFPHPADDRNERRSRRGRRREGEGEGEGPRRRGPTRRGRGGAPASGQATTVHFKAQRRGRAAPLFPATPFRGAPRG